jgi:hypothetical protein
LGRFANIRRALESARVLQQRRGNWTLPAWSHSGKRISESTSEKKTPCSKHESRVATAKIRNQKQAVHVQQLRPRADPRRRTSYGSRCASERSSKKRGDRVMHTTGLDEEMIPSISTTFLMLLRPSSALCWSFHRAFFPIFRTTLFKMCFYTSIDTSVSLLTKTPRTLRSMRAKTLVTVTTWHGRQQPLHETHLLLECVRFQR